MVFQHFIQEKSVVEKAISHTFEQYVFQVPNIRYILFLTLCRGKKKNRIQTILLLQRKLSLK